MKPECDLKNCKQVQSIIGQCKFCTNTYCINHRYAEAHSCSEMSKCIQRAKDLNSHYIMNSKLDKFYN
jgi:predicted nucleic acid binding AN1-type Zn finger protein